MAFQKHSDQRRQTIGPTSPNPLVLPPVNLDHGLAEVKLYADWGELGGELLNIIFGVKPENRPLVRLATRVGVGLYGVKVVSDKTQAQAALLNRQFGHLKIYTPPAPASAPYTVDMTEKKSGPPPGWKPNQTLSKRTI